MARGTWATQKSANLSTLESSNSDAAGKVTVSMIWGCQYDQALKMSLRDKSDFLSNYDRFGVFNYSDEKSSGSKEAAFNIFDLIGNVFDYTREYGPGMVTRGGSWSTGDVEYGGYFIDRLYNYGYRYGYRVQMYMN